MNDGDFYKTRMGQRFYERTMPALVEAVERLANGVSKNRDPVVLWRERVLRVLNIFLLRSRKAAAPLRMADTTTSSAKK